jgi:glutaredoxin
LIALAIAIFIILIIVFLSKTEGNGIYLNDGSTLPQDVCQKLGKVTIIHEAGCSACAIALPRLRELEQEMNMSFDYYDIVIDNDKNKLLSLNLMPRAVPTIIINCKVYVGVREKEEYRLAIQAIGG